MFTAFVISWLASMTAVCLPPNAAAGWRWADGLTLGLAALATLLTLGRQLPWQNVVAAALMVALVSSGLFLAGDFIGIPLGPLTCSDSLGPKVFGRLPWAFLVVWMVSVFNAYGVAQLLLRSFRAGQYYGWGLLGLTGLLVVIFGLALEPFAVPVKGYWSWPTHGSALNWYSVPGASLAGRFVATVAILFFTTPWLIDKRGVERPADYHSLALWLLLSLLFAVGSAMQHLWWAVAVNLPLSLLVGIPALRGRHPRTACDEKRFVA